MKRQTGFTLIEIMIAFLLGMIIIAATMSIYISTIQGSSDTLKSARLNHDLDMTMSLIVNDIRRAGFWAGAIVTGNPDPFSNPFNAATTTVQIRNLAAPTTAVNSGDCILYSYDADADAAVDAGTAPDNEYYGFRLNTNAVQMRTSGTTNADCSNGTWNTITEDNEISVTALAFSQAQSQYFDLTTTTAYATKTLYDAAVTGGTVSTGDEIVETRQIDVSIAGTLVDDNNVNKNLTATVSIKNNRLFLQP